MEQRGLCEAAIYDKLHIDVMVVDPVSGVDLCHFTGFYGEAKRELRHRS